MKKSKGTLCVRELRSDDAYAYSKIAYGETLHQYASFFEARTISEAQKRITENTNHYERIYGLFSKSNTLLGVFIVSERSDNSATVHYFVGEKHRGKSFASRGLKLLAQQLAFEGKYAFLFFEIRKTNTSSLAVQQKLGSTKTSENANYAFFCYAV